MQVEILHQFEEGEIDSVQAGDAFEQCWQNQRSESMQAMEKEKKAQEEILEDKRRELAAYELSKEMAERAECVKGLEKHYSECVARHAEMASKASRVGQAIHKLRFRQVALALLKGDKAAQGMQCESKEDKEALQLQRDVANLSEGVALARSRVNKHNVDTAAMIHNKVQPYNIIL